MIGSWDALLPADVWLVVPYPPRRFWVNLHPNVLHLIETREASLIERCRQEGERAQADGYGEPSEDTVAELEALTARRWKWA